MNIAGLTTDDLCAWAQARGATPAAARTLARFLVARFAGKKPTSTPARALLDAASAEISSALPEAEAVPAADETVRFAVKLADGAVVETVLIRQPARWTICVSSQVGCSRGCVFCETGRLGLTRNLEPHEIVAQYVIAQRHLIALPYLQLPIDPQSPLPPLRGRVRVGGPANVVFMGMGEPLDNLDAVLQAINVLSDPLGFAVPIRRITISTVGIVPQMDELYRRSRANVAVSLHALEPATRLKLLPIARKWSIDELRAAIARSPRTILLQWTLIEGVNDREADADALLAFARALDVRVNLIPLNPGPAEKLRAPTLAQVRAFQRRLADGGLRTLVRLPHGQAVGGACGQLAGRRRVPFTDRD